MWKLLLFSILLSGCLPMSGSEIESTEESLLITGRVIDETDVGMVGANIYVGDIQDVAGAAGEDGRFTIELNNAEIRVIENQAKALQKIAYRLYFRGAEDNKVGISSEIPVGSRGSVDLENIVLTDGVDLTGKVFFIDGQTGALAGSDASVKLDRWQTIADENGEFTLTNVPIGEMELTVTGLGFRSYTRTINSDGSNLQEVLDNIYLFENSGITGALFIDETAESLQGPDPFKKVFSVKYSSEVAFIRISEDIRAVQVAEDSNIIVVDESTNNPVARLPVEPAPWLPIASQLSYNFQTLGDKRVYFQFADRTLQSEVYSYEFTLDIFNSIGSVEINDDAEETNASLVNLSIQVPVGAVGMKIAEKEEDLAEAAIIEPVESMTYQLQNGLANDVRTVLVQFVDESGLESLIHEDSIELKLFPNDINDVLSYQIASIGEESAELNIAIAAPLGVTEYRISDAAPAEEDPWLAIQPVVEYTTFKTRLGLLNAFIFIELRDEFDNRSEILGLQVQQ